MLDPCLYPASARILTTNIAHTGDVQKKNIVPAAPSSSTPTGAEFHCNRPTWNPRYDKYRDTARPFRQTDLRCAFLCRRNSDEKMFAMMKIPIAHMKKATVGSANTWSAMYLANPSASSQGREKENPHTKSASAFYTTRTPLLSLCHTWTCACP